MARFLTCLERADADALKDLHERVSQKRAPEDPLVALVYQVLSRRRSGQHYHAHGDDERYLQALRATGTGWR